MTEWNVLLVIGEVIALFLLVGKPLMSLNTTIATLRAAVETLNSRLDNQEAKNHEAHKDFYEHLEANDLTLADHEFRLKSLEKNN